MAHHHGYLFVADEVRVISRLLLVAAPSLAFCSLGSLLEHTLAVGWMTLAEVLPAFDLVAALIYFDGHFRGRLMEGSQMSRTPVSHFVPADFAGESGWNAC